MSTAANSSDASALRVSAAFLLPQDRIARAPLGTWAVQLRARLRRCREQCRTIAQLSEQVGGIANNASLIAAQRGAEAVARRLCERQLWWQARLSRRSHHAAVSAGCVQPWVNLARLESLSGEWQSAIARLDALRVRRARSALALQPLRSDGVGCQRVRVAGDFAQSLEAVWVIDSLRVLLQNGRFDEVMDFVARMHAERDGGLVLWADEATVVAACRRGDVEGAEQAARAALGRAESVGWAREVFRLRLAEVLVCTGQIPRAARILEGMAAAMDRLSAAVLSRLQTLYVLMPLASACWQAGLAQQASRLARIVYEGARTANDEVFEVEALRLLVLAAPGAEREEWRRALHSLEVGTDYRRYRRSGEPSLAASEFEALDSELEDALST